MKQWLLDLILQVLTAQATPYFHLYGYMMRWWLVPYNQVIERKLCTDPDEEWGTSGGRGPVVTTDGTGPVDWKKRPIARLFQKLGVAIRLHEILRSDTGRDPHDHPWAYLTLILRGGYFEHRFDDEGFLVDIEWHGPGSILFRRAGSFHKLVLPDGERCTTLFCTFKKVKRWGFMTPEGFVPYDKYPGRND